MGSLSVRQTKLWPKQRESRDSRHHLDLTTGEAIVRQSLSPDRGSVCVGNASSFSSKTSMWPSAEQAARQGSSPLCSYLVSEDAVVAALRRGARAPAFKLLKQLRTSKCDRAVAAG